MAKKDNALDIARQLDLAMRLDDENGVDVNRLARVKFLEPQFYEARFFFVDPENAHSFDMSIVPMEDVIGSKVFPGKPSDKNLRDEAHRLIMLKEAHIARTETHSVVADVAIDKSSGGFGASRPEETVILFKPSACLGCVVLDNVCACVSECA